MEVSIKGGTEICEKPLFLHFFFQPTIWLEGGNAHGPIGYEIALMNEGDG